MARKFRITTPRLKIVNKEIFSPKNISKKSFKLDPINKDILRVLLKAKMRATPSKIADTINIHPSTAKRRLSILSKEGLVNLKFRGNRTLAKANKSNIKRRLKG